MTQTEERCWKYLLANRQATAKDVALNCDVSENYASALMGRISSENWRSERPKADERRVQILKDAAQAIGNESQNLVPVDTGNLKGSMSYERSGVTTTTPVIEIRYGTPYALYQHEKLDLYHPARDGNTAGRRGSGPTAPGTEGGSPKYLEFPFLAETSQYPTKLVERIRRHFNVVRARGTG